MTELSCDNVEISSLSPEHWSVQHVCKWLVNNGLDEYQSRFIEEAIDGEALLLLSEPDLHRIVNRLGDVKRLSRLLVNLHSTHPTSHLFVHNFVNGIGSSTKQHPISSNENLPDSKPLVFLPEYGKLVLSYIYMFFVFWITALTMVIVHERVPDMKRYPPLPDLFLDNMPYVSWAFPMCEVAGILLLAIWSLVIFFHKYRFILMRRMFALTGTVFLLRCCTMLITSLSVPGIHLKCAPKTNESDYWTMIARTYEIWSKFGMSLQGVRTCGDYMFSGHTVTVTMLNFFITEYTPVSFYWLHTTSWILNIFGIFFILAAHEHYSIDVFIAFYITSRLFLYYHSLANNRALMQQDRRRTRIWYPLFSFFESKCNGVVPNEYEWPIPCLGKIWRFAFGSFIDQTDLKSD